MDEDVLLRDFFGLGDESLLEGLDFLDELVSVDISGLKLSPSMDVEGLAKLVLKEFGFLLLLKELFL